MSSPLFDIVFRGDILPGQNLIEVKQRLAQLFKADEAKINNLFTGGAVALKRNLEKAVADKYVTALNQAGADVQLMEAGKLAARAARKPVPRNPQVAVSTSVPPKKTLAERIAAQQLEAEKQTPQKASGVEATVDDSGLSLAPVGADVLRPEERTHTNPVEVDVSGLSLREAEGNLLDAGEISNPPVVDIDVSEFSVSEVGEDLLLDSERHEIVELDLDLSGIDLAEAGSDMGQIKPSDPPPPPDTSNIHLQE